MHAFVTTVKYSFERAINAGDAGDAGDAEGADDAEGAEETKLLCFNLALLTKALQESSIEQLDTYSIEATEIDKNAA